jgi:hypothetical protein
MTLEEGARAAIDAIRGINFVLIVVMLVYLYASPFILFLSIWNLRKTHANHIYVIWLFFSFFFVLFFFLFVAAAESSVQLEDLFGGEAKKIFVIVLSWLRDGEGEIKLVLVMVGLVVLPQWLTYVLSGLSGSASPPVFVSQVTDLAIWSLVKFSAALAGIVVAEPVVKLLMIGSIDSFLILETVGLLGVAFFLVWINSVARYGMGHLSQQRAFRTLRPLHGFFTRFSGEKSRDGDGSTGAAGERMSADAQSEPPPISTVAPL